MVYSIINILFVRKPTTIIGDFIYFGKDAVVGMLSVFPMFRSSVIPITAAYVVAPVPLRNSTFDRMPFEHIMLSYHPGWQLQFASPAAATPPFTTRYCENTARIYFDSHPIFFPSA